MRITSKGQVTIPVRIREQAGLLPNTEVEFACEGNTAVIFPAKKRPRKKPTRGEKLVEHLKKFGERHPIGMTTDEIMALTRGEY